MSLFDVIRRTYDVKRLSGAYADGVWVSDVTETTTTGSFHALSPQEVELLPEGLRARGVTMTYLSQDALEFNEEETQKSDRILYGPNGGTPREFEVVGRVPLGSQLTHPEFMAGVHQMCWRYYVSEVQSPDGGLEEGSGGGSS